jgi:hypothetical protein
MHDFVGQQNVAQWYRVGFSALPTGYANCGKRQNIHTSSQQELLTIPGSLRGLPLASFKAQRQLGRILLAKPKEQ